jgi:hypothetical protein
MHRVVAGGWSGLVFSVIALMATASAAQAPPADPLAEARQLYNAHQYDAAIALSAEVRRRPDLTAAATVIFARAHLEKYRLAGQPLDLGEARDALRSVDAARLPPREEVEYIVGLGECLYFDDEYAFDDRFSAAAELFEVALARADLLDETSRDLLFDWWALALDRQAQLGLEDERAGVYARVVARAEAELARKPASLSATYWLAAAAFGADDVTRAWGAAVAGWVRAVSFGDRGTGLREDLDRLMVRTILPARARKLVVDGDPRPVLASLEVQWNQIKDRWN